MDDGPYYLEGGNITNVVFTVYVQNLEESSEFYRDSLLLEETKENLFKIPKTSCLLRLEEGMPENKNTGITFITDSVFTYHRKLVDENVVILKKPAKNKEGNVEAAFADPDGNVFKILEIN